MQNYLQEFLDVKALEGCSKATIENYKFNLNKFLLGIGKDPTEIATQDIRKYSGCFNLGTRYNICS